MYKNIRTFLYNWRTPILLILTFFLGALTGVFTESAILITKLRTNIGQGPEIMIKLVQNRLTYKLGLDAKQQEELKPILADSTDKLKEIRSKAAPEIQAVIVDAEGRIEKILRPAQVDLLHKGEERARKKFGNSPFFPSQLGQTPSSDSH